MGYTTMEMTGPAAAITLTPDRAAIDGEGRDLSFITATIVDAEGRTVPTADNSMSFSVNGPGRIATDNGNPMDRTVFSSPTPDAFSGLALAIIAAAPSQSGEVVVTATSEGLTTGEVVVTAD